MKNQGNQNLDVQIQKLTKIITHLINNKKVKTQYKEQKFIIGVCGIPGSGKSTLSQKLTKQLKNSIVLPMDGFHIERKFLTQEGIKRRGAAFTFDLEKFQQKMYEIRNAPINIKIKYPNFDHKQKDPVQDAIQISPQDQILIVQGIYVFDRHLKINNKNNEGNQFWDFQIWVDSQLESSIIRVAKRHLTSGIQPNYELAYQRATSNDRLNANYILQNCFREGSFKKINDWEEGDKKIIIQNNLSW